MRKFIIVSLLLFFSLFSFSQKNKGDSPLGTFILEKQFKDYVPVSPLDYEDYVSVYNPDSNKFVWKMIPEIAIEKDKMVKFLPNEAVYVTVRKIDVNGGINWGVSSVTAEKGSYTVIMDYCKFTTLKAYENDSLCIGFTKVGVGLRITANIETAKAGLNIGSLFGLGIAAQGGKLTGTMSIDVIGMESKQITDLLPLPSEISPASIQNCLQAMAAIKTKIYDTDTRLFPQIVAVKSSSDGNCSALDILKGINKTPIQQLQQQQQQQQIQQKL